MIGKLWVDSGQKTELVAPYEKALLCKHELPHTARAFLCCPLEESASFTMVGGGKLADKNWNRVLIDRRPVMKPRTPVEHTVAN